jgi:CubicO group peptidase (beta-lactamase class C family)
MTTHRLFSLLLAASLLPCATLAQDTVPNHFAPFNPGSAIANSPTTSPQLSVDLREQVDAAAKAAVASSGVPSASHRHREGRPNIVYSQAYGDARLQPRRPARPDMRYSIGSISKQFTAVAAAYAAGRRQAKH